MEEARRVLGAGPAMSTAFTNTNPSAPLKVYQTGSQTPSQPQPTPSPLSGHAHLAPSNTAPRHSPSQPTTNATTGTSSIFANPTSYAPIPPHSTPQPYSSLPASSLSGRPPSQQAVTSSQPIPTSRPSEKPVTSADLLEQARALRKNATQTAATNSTQPPTSTTSPPQDTSSTPQESMSVQAPAVPATKPPIPTSKPSAAPDPVQSAVAAAGHVAPFSTSAPQLGLGIPASVPLETNRSVTNSKKRKNEESENAGGSSKAKTRTRSTSNLEAPIVGQQTNEPHFNPFEITHFLPFSTATPSAPISPSTRKPPPNFSDDSNSTKAPISNPSLRPDTSSRSAETLSPHSTVNTKFPSADPSIAKPVFPDTLTPALASTHGLGNGTTSSNFGAPPTAILDPSHFDSISLSMSLDPQAASRPTTSWSGNDAAIANGLSSFDPFGGGLDGFDFSSSAFDNGLSTMESQTLGHKSTGNGLPNWSPDGLDGFDFGNTFR